MMQTVSVVFVVKEAINFAGTQGIGLRSIRSWLVLGLGVIVKLARLSDTCRVGATWEELITFAAAEGTNQ